MESLGDNNYAVVLIKRSLGPDVHWKKLKCLLGCVMKFTPPQLGRRAETGERMHCRLMDPKPETYWDGEEESDLWFGWRSITYPLGYDIRICSWAACSAEHACVWLTQRGQPMTECLPDVAGSGMCVLSGIQFPEEGTSGSTPSPP